MRGQVTRQVSGEGAGYQAGLRCEDRVPGRSHVRD